MKYKIKYDFKDERENNKYIVSIEGVMNDETTAVRDKSRGLLECYYNQVCCKVHDNGNGISVVLDDGSRFYLDYAQEQHVLTALLARSKKTGYKVKIKEKI